MANEYADDYACDETCQLYHDLDNAERLGMPLGEYLACDSDSDIAVGAFLAIAFTIVMSVSAMLAWYYVS